MRYCNPRYDITSERTLVNASIANDVARGKAEEKLETASRLKALGVDIDTIAKGTGLSKVEVEIEQL